MICAKIRAKAPSIQGVQRNMTSDISREKARFDGALCAEIGLITPRSAVRFRPSPPNLKQNLALRRRSVKVESQVQTFCADFRAKCPGHSPDNSGESRP